MNWSNAQSALAAWLKTGSGYVTGKVVWRDQDNVRPPGDHITVKVIAIVPQGQDELRTTQTELDVNGEPVDASKAPDLTPGLEVPGKEILFEVFGTVNLKLSIQAHCSSVVGTGQAIAVLSRVRMALGLPTVRGALQVAGLTPVGSAGPIQDLTAVLGTAHESVAVFSAEFTAVESASEEVTYIRQATLEYEGDLVE